MHKYDVCTPLLNGNEKKYLIDCIDSGWISSDGPYVKEFETNFSKYIGVNHGISVSNGTAALHAAMYALNIQENDEVIMPSFTIISCALSVLRFGAKPVFVDIESDGWNIDANLIENKINKKTKAIMAIHMYGHPCDFDRIKEIALKYNLLIIEDASQVHGALYKQKKCGSLGDISTFSFYANKIISTGEGGMVLTTNILYAERARSYRNLCFKPEKRFYHEDLGDNLRLTNLQAAIGLAQLERINDFVDRKRINGQAYVKYLGDIEGIKYQIEKPWAKMVYWMYCIQFNENLGINAKEIIDDLSKMGVSSRPFFLGMHEQPILRHLSNFKPGEFSNTEKASRLGLYLPSSINLEENDIINIVNILKKILLKYS